jgi:hypothetical protein
MFRVYLSRQGRNPSSPSGVRVGGLQLRKGRKAQPPPLGKAAKSETLRVAGAAVALLAGSIPASALFRRGMTIEGCRAFIPVPALRGRHLAHDEVT